MLAHVIAQLTHVGAQDPDPDPDLATDPNSFKDDGCSEWLTSKSILYGPGDTKTKMADVSVTTCDAATLDQCYRAVTSSATSPFPRVASCYSYDENNYELIDKTEMA